MNKFRILRKSDALLYAMPSLDEHTVRYSDGSGSQHIENIQKNAYEEGFSLGEKAGLAEGKKKSEMLARQMIDLTGQMAEIRDSLSAQLEAQIVELAFAVAKKITIEEIKTNPLIIASMVKEALKKIKKSKTVRIKINPAVYDLLVDKQQDIGGIHEGIVFEIDKGVMPEGPLVISETEEVVTDIDSMLDNIKDEMSDIIQTEKGNKTEDDNN